MQDRFSFSGHIFSTMEEDYTPPPTTPTSTPPTSTPAAPKASMTTPTSSSSTPSNPIPAASSTPSTPSKPPVHNGLASYKESGIPLNKEFYERILRENMDIYDIDTLNGCLALNEAEQNSLLISLTNKLYQMVVDKVEDIDYGDIPQSKGDIRRLSKYKQLKECIATLHDIFEQYKEDTTPIDVIDNAMKNLENDRDLYIASYLGGIEMGVMVYSNVALGIVNSISFMIAVCINYIKDPKNEGLKIVVDKTGPARVKDHIVYENLIKFNEASKNGSIENSLRPLIKNRVKSFAGTAGIIWLGIKTAVVLGTLVVAVVPLIRDLVYFAYATRARMSAYLDIQADFLEMNATELENNPNIKTEDDKKKVITRQLAIARMFHKLANTIAVDAKSAEVKATKDIKDDTKKYRIDEVNTDPSSSEADGPLF